MASASKKEHLAATSPADSDFAVQAINREGTIPVDGPIVEVNQSSVESPSPSSNINTLSAFVELILDSPFHSPKPTNEDGLSDTSLGGGEVPEHVLPSSVGVQAVSPSDQNGVSKPESKNTGDGAIPEEKVEGHEDTNGALTTTSKLYDESKAVKSSTEEAAVETEIDTSDATKASQEATESGPTAPGAGESVAVIDGEETAVESLKGPEPTRSVPPPLQPNFQSTEARQSSPQDSRNSMPAPSIPHYSAEPLRAPRSYPIAYSYRGDGNGEELARMRAQLMKTRNELDAERIKNATLRKTVEMERQKETDAALSSMTMDLLRNQTNTLARQAKVEAIERDLEYRAKRIEQLEVYLSEGQKQAYHKYDEEEKDDRTMGYVNREHDRRQAELKAQKEIADREAKLAVQMQGLQLREAAQQMREQQYMACTRKAVEAELRERSIPEMNAKLAEIADVEYNRGFGAGKEAGRTEAEDGARQKGFLEGYSACRRAGVVLSKVRQGLIACDSPELDFIYDAAHPHNLCAIGEKLGRLELGKEELEKIKSRDVNGVKKKEPAVEQKKEEASRKFPPPRPTFASELRGAQTMHNGHIVLANGSASLSPAPTPRVNGVPNGANGRSVASSTGEGDCAGRGIREYGEQDLIDLS